MGSNSLIIYMTMEIESQNKFGRKEKSCQYSLVVKQLEKSNFNLNRALGLSKNVQNAKKLCEYLVQYSQKISPIQLKINIDSLLIQIWRFRDEIQTSNFEFIKWIVKAIYQIRWAIDANKYQRQENIMKFLNQLMKMLHNLLRKIKQINRSKIDEINLQKTLISMIDQYERIMPFQKLSNLLFSLNLLLKFQVASDNKQRQQALVQFYLNKLDAFNSNNSLQIQQIMASTYLNCVNIYPRLHNKFQNFITKSTFYQKLIMLQRSCFEQSTLNLLMLDSCTFEQELQIITQIVIKHFNHSGYLLRQDLCLFWLSNARKLLQQDPQINLTNYIDSFQVQILSNMLRILNQQLSKHLINAERQTVLSIWMKILFDQKAKKYLLQSKDLFISTEMIIYRFLRQALGQLPCTLRIYEVQIIVQVYSQYFEYFLQQKQCDKLRQMAINLYVDLCPKYVRSSMLLKQGINYKEATQSNFINLSLFDQKKLSMLLIRHKNRQQRLTDILNKLNKQVGVILVKYIAQREMQIFQNIFVESQIIQFLMQNNIQLHDDRLDYALHEKISSNLQKYVKIIRKCCHNKKNRYEKKINIYIIDLLRSQVLQQSGLKLIPVSINTIMYIVERYNDIYDIVTENGDDTVELITSLYALAMRSLYLNIPDAIYLLLLAINDLKQDHQRVPFEIQRLLIDNLLKFCKQYSNHDSFCLIGYASIFLLLYGSPISNSDTIVFHQIIQCMSQHDYFFGKCIEILQKLISIQNRKCILERKQQEMNKKMMKQYMEVFYKNFIYGLLKNILFVSSKNCLQYTYQIFNIKKLIQQFLCSQVGTITNNDGIIGHHHLLTNKNKKRTFQFGDNQQFSIDTVMVNHSQTEIPCLQRQDNNLSVLLHKFKHFDQFKYFRQIQMRMHYAPSRQYDSTARQNRQFYNLQRVDGKVRSIIHIMK